MTTDKPLSKAAQKRHDRAEAITRLRSYLKPGDTVYTVLRHVSSSGMSRRITLHIVQDGQPFDISGWAAEAMDYRRNDRDGGLVVGGCGMDMGFHIVYHLSRVLFPDGFGEKCCEADCDYRPATREEAETCNDHLPVGISKHRFRGRNGDTSGWDNDGGYALKQRWM